MTDVLGCPAVHGGTPTALVSAAGGRRSAVLVAPSLPPAFQAARLPYVIGHPGSNQAVSDCADSCCTGSFQSGPCLY